MMKYIENLKGIDKRDLSTFIKKVLECLPVVKKMLVIFPDYTRVDFTDSIVPLILDWRRINGIKNVDFLNAGGTHRPMSDEEFISKLGIAKKDPAINFYNHNYSDPKNLVTVGQIPSKAVKDKTSGRLNVSIPITINKLVFDEYDLIIAISGTTPHEASGYSGGLKIFFPGISGPEVIDLFHWAAAMVGLPNIIGTVSNNARDIINIGSKAIFDQTRAKILSFNMVNTEIDGKVFPIGLYVGLGYKGFLKAYKLAAAASSKVHAKYIEKSLSQVVQVIPACYDEIWTAGKGSYKLQKPGVMAEDGEIILYAPHIKCFHSKKEMEADILELGYHCKDYICKLLERGAGACKNVAAHVINVAGPGIFNPSTGKEKLHFKVTLATSIPEKVCKKVGLGYREPATIKKSDFTGSGKLWIEEGGKYLYDLKNK